ncbi:MAG TPA: 50S ribosomal protein L9 [Pseudomonadota bacterium]|nr:50S ribosomal protein L9 [Pseudomonadota bacterium]
MRIILREEIQNLGKGGDVVSVKPGYGRNFLIPQGLAVLATERNVRQVEHHKKVIAARNAKLQKDAQAVADKLSSLHVRIERQTGEGGKLYGSISTRDVEEAVRALGVTIDRKKLVIENPIKSTGDYTVELKLGQNVVAKIKLTVAEAKSAS